MKPQKWEYQIHSVFNHELSEQNIPSFLNQEGQKGWELVNVEVRYAIDEPIQVNRRKFYFKRELK